MMLALLAVSALLSLGAAIALPLVADVHGATHVHLAFAMGMMPLMLGAMTHFVPVLTRTRGVGRGIGGLPLVAWVGGALIVAFFAFNLPWPYRNLAAVTALGTCAVLAAWQFGRIRAALGGVHPGVRWYLAALACLGLSLLAVLAMSVWPAHFLAFKRLHLHLNLFGFVGLTAIGTLRVLLPTAAERPDPDAAARLRADLLLAAGGALLIALGAAWWPVLSWPGLLLWLIPALRLAGGWLGRYRAEIFAWHGAVPLLAAAVAGFVAALAAGGLHGMGWASAGGAGHLFVFAFLFPLVSGAAGQLLPLWLRPGRQTPWHAAARRRLTRGGGIRALLLCAGGGVALAGVPWGTGLALAGLLPFALAAGWEVLQSRRP